MRLSAAGRRAGRGLKRTEPDPDFADKEFRDVLRLLGSLDVVPLGGRSVAVQAARNFRTLRDKGVTVRKTIDCVIATRCIVDGLTLLHSDRDFEPFVVHLGLQSVF